MTSQEKVLAPMRKDNHTDTLLRHDLKSSPEWKVILLALVLLAVDFILGPYIQFPVFFVLPVILAAWLSGMRLAIILAVALAAIRLTFHWIWEFPSDFMPAVVNNLMRACVLLIVGYGTAKTAMHMKNLQKRVELLEKQLPVCSCCGLIRDGKGSWIPLNDLPPSDKSQALCPRCEEKHYGTFS